MNRIISKIGVLIFCGLILSFFVSVRAQSNSADDLGASTPKIKTSPISIPKLSVRVPSLNLRESTCSETECTNPWLVDYIVAIYKYGIGIIGILAVITIMIGGIIWLTASGNSERVGEAKKWIGGSIFGVFIAFTSYLILNFVNPTLTQLSPIKIVSIERIDLEVLDAGEATTVATGENGVIGTSTGQYKVPWILQNSAEIGSYDYGYGGTISSSGCGITALTMVLNFYGINTTVPQMADKMKKNGGRIQGGGTSNSKIEEVMREYGLKTERASTFDGAINLLSKGPVVISIWDKTPAGDPKSCPFTNRKHYIVFTGYENGNVKVNDPSNKNQDSGRMSISLSDLKQKCDFGSGAIVSYK